MVSWLRVGVGKDMKRMYAYFFLLFAGSLLPFLIVEFYFQNYFTIGVIAIIASVILILCVSIEYLRVKYMRWLDVRNKKIDYLNWTQKKEETGRVSFYYFRNRLHWYSIIIPLFFDYSKSHIVAINDSNNFCFLKINDQLFSICLNVLS